MNKNILLFIFISCVSFLQLGFAQSHNNGPISNSTRNTPSNAAVDVDINNLGGVVFAGKNQESSSGAYSHWWDDQDNLLSIGKVGSTNTLFGTGTESASFMFNFSAHPILFGTNFAERMRISTDGNVGIGTTDPLEKLEVNGELLVSVGGVKGTQIHYGFGPRFGAASPPNYANGLGTDDGQGSLFEHKSPNSLEGSGIFSSGDYSLIWNPGDFGYLLQIRDQDTDIIEWWVDGDGVTNETSDRRRKENIEQLDAGTLEKVLSLRGVKYGWKATEEEKAKEEHISYTTLGVIAQELEPLFPELVRTNHQGIKGVHYGGFASVFIEAFKEQHAIIKEKENRINDLETDLSKVKQQLEELQSMVQQLSNNKTNNNATNPSMHQQQINLTVPTLQQNQPNPFNGQTSIRYYLPETTQKAQIQINDINGKVLRVENIQNVGHGILNLDAKALPQGTYSYSLIVDGQLVETKQMILVK